MNIGFQIWHLLRYPPTQQRLFKETTRRKSARLFHVRIGRWVQIAGLLMLAVSFLLSRTLFVILIAVVPFALIISFMLTSGSFYGGWRAIQTVTRLTTMQRSGLYEQVQLTNPGEPGVLLLVSAGFLHRADLLREIHSLLRTILRLILIATGLLAVMLIAGTVLSPPPISGEPGGLIILSGVFPLAALAIMLYVDFIYAIVTAALFAALIVQFTQKRFEAQLWTATLFIGTQLAQYLLWLILMILSSFAVQTLLGITSITNMSLAAFATLLFYIIHEAAVGILWRALLYKTGTTYQEWQGLRVWWGG